MINGFKTGKGLLGKTLWRTGLILLLVPLLLYALDDVKIKLTDTGGTSTFAIQNSTPATVFQIDSLGNVDLGTWNATNIAIAKGGTGQSTANAAFNALAPSQTGNAGKFLTTDATNTSWATSVSGATIDLNASSNFATNINTGTSTGTVSIGSTTGTAGISQRVGTGNFSLDGVAGSTYTIGASTTTGSITIGGTAQTGNMTLGSSSGTNNLYVANGSGATTLNLANVQNAGAVNIGAGMTTGTITIGGTGAQTGAISIGTGTGAQTLNLGTGGTGIKTINIGTNATPVNVISIGGAASTMTIGSVKNTIGIAGVANGNGVRIGNARLTVNKPTAPTTGLNANTTATVTQILDAGVIGFAASAARTLTFPTAQGATGLVQALPGTPAIGDTFTFVVFNTGTSAVSLVAGAGITIVNTTTITGLSNGTRVVTCRVTGVTPGSETISVY